MPSALTPDAPDAPEAPEAPGARGEAGPLRAPQRAWRARPGLLAGVALMVASGAAGLGWQLVWTQQLGLALGHESAAVLAVLAAFFGGLALGAGWLWPRLARRWAPLVAYAGAEALVAVWGGALLGLAAPVAEALRAATGPQPGALWQWSVCFGGTAALLLPATVAMGATLPAMQRLLLEPNAQDEAPARAGAAGRCTAWLYAANTAGALVGVLGGALWALPALGLRGTGAACVALNAACALLAVVAVVAGGRGGSAHGAAASGPVAAPGLAAPAAAPAAPAAPAGRASVPGFSHVLARRRAQGHRHRVQLRLALTGWLGIGLEVLGVRVLSQLCEDTVYTFALLLAVVLAGSAAGAALWPALDRAWRRWQRAPLPVMGPMAAAAALAAWALWQADALRALALEAALAAGAGASGWPLAAGGGLTQLAAGGGLTQLTAGAGLEAWLALCVFGPASVAMGVVFAQQADEARALGLDLGRVLAINTAGAALAPPLWGVLAPQLLGAGGALLALLAGYVGLAAAELGLGRGLWRRAPGTGPASGTRGRRARGRTGGLGRPGRPAWLLALGAVLALPVAAVLAPPLAFVTLPEGGRLLTYREGPAAAVSVVVDAQGVRSLRIDNRQQEGSSATAYVDGRQALLPLLLHGAARRALFLGLGSGVTAATAALDPQLEVTAVELLPEVIAASAAFAGVVPAGHARLHTVAADARRYVRNSPVPFDLVVADNFHPARRGSAALYTVEHFAAVRARLAPGGLFVQWLPLHQLDAATLAPIVRSFLAAFPQGRALLAHNGLTTPVLGLAGGAGPTGAPPDDPARSEAARRRLGALQPLADWGLDDPLAVAGAWLAGPGALARWSAGAPLNTDDHPVVAWLAPRLVYEAAMAEAGPGQTPGQTPGERLLALLAAWSPDGLADDAAGPPRGAAPAAASATDTDTASATATATAEPSRERLAAWRAARRLFLQAGVQARPTADPAAMLAQVGRPLLAALQASPEFRPAAVPLDRLVQALAQRDPGAAAPWQAQLQAIQRRREAGAAARAGG